MVAAKVVATPMAAAARRLALRSWLGPGAALIDDHGHAGLQAVATDFSHAAVADAHLARVRAAAGRL